ncbi:cell division protein FtsL [Salinispirillum marinum]|uniref:Cell division protein FtsL n=2 Tax=Saccharospirillaceae TaxID=255527 RepID=A0ABV8B9E9_9GAMM
MNRIRPGWYFLVAVIWASGLSVVFVSHETRMLHAELNQLTRHYAQQRVEWGQLTLELGAVAAPGLIEQRAQQLGLRPPNASEVQVIGGRQP